MAQTLESVLANGGATSVALYLSNDHSFTQAQAYARQRWGLSEGDAYRLATLGSAAVNAAQIISGGDTNSPQQLDAVPINPYVDDGDFAGSREQVAIEIFVPEAGGGTGQPYLIIISATGLESISELLRIAVDDLCKRAKKSPTAFPDVDCDNVFIFDYDILSTVRAF